MILAIRQRWRAYCRGDIFTAAFVSRRAFVAPILSGIGSALSRDVGSVPAPWNVGITRAAKPARFGVPARPRYPR